MNKDPFFSVILPVYNGQEYIRQAIDSVLEQTFPFWELIVVDDVSTDQTPAILEEYQKKDGRIRIIRNAEKMLPGGSNNRGIEAARGSWLAHIDHDDVFYPHFLERLFDYCFRIADPRVFVTTWVQIIDEKGDKVLDVQLPGHSKIQKLMKAENCVFHSATAFQKELWAKVGGYPYQQKRRIDWALWLKFLEEDAKLLVVPEALIGYRIHYNNLTYYIDDLNAETSMMAFQRNVEWKVSLLLKQQMLKEARRELKRLFQVQRKASVKNLAYYYLTYLPSSLVSFFMWEIRPKARGFVRDRLKIG